MQFVPGEDRQVLVYTRTSAEQSVMVLMNFSGKMQEAKVSEMDHKWQLLYSTNRDVIHPTHSAGLRLGAYEVCLLVKGK